MRHRLIVLEVFIIALSSQAYVFVHQKQRTFTGSVGPRFDGGSTLEPSTDSGDLPSALPAQPDTNDIRLEPFLLAADFNYRNVGPVGHGDFVVSRDGEPRANELVNDNILRIVRGNCTDLEVNTLVWKCLGYRFANGAWTCEKVFPKWRDKYPDPPDFIGMQRVYSKQVDEPSLRANQQLVRSIPAEHKQQLRLHLKPMGFDGFKIATLTPNKTRRAQCANWLLYYREHLFGYTLEDLIERRNRREDEKASRQVQQQSIDEDWRPPIKEVF
ncbi:hypothetical protein MPSEU_000725500 [Mayamaea pseudoterrestris]|nr:hypothetical protein MPSEU_000725500 [Mayamaea pseudoterrestris]